MPKNTIDNPNIIELILIFTSGLLTFLAPSFVIIGGLIFAAVVDHFFGVWKARKKGEAIRFWIGLWDTVTKAVMYTLLVWLALICDKSVINDLITLFLGKPEVEYIFTKFIALGLFSWEYVSINKSFKDVKGVSIHFALLSSVKKGRELADEISKVKKSIKE